MKRWIGTTAVRELRPGPLAVATVLALGVAACAGSDDAQVGSAEVESDDSGSDRLEDEAGDPAEEFIELPYWDVQVGGDATSVVISPPEECDNSDPARQVCEYEMSIELFSSLGETTSRGTGTMTVESSGCAASDGRGGDLYVFSGQGVITTPGGEELFFTGGSDKCTAVPGVTTDFWRVTGGTGRFEGATGLMNGGNIELQSETGTIKIQSLSTGTLTVRADLWEELLPPDGVTD